MLPDRTPSTGLLEAKAVWQPVAVRPVCLEEGRVAVSNRLDFRSLAYLEGSWEMTRDGETIECGTLPPLDTPPRETEEIRLPYPLPDRGLCFLNLRFTRREPADGQPAGSEAAFVQLPLPVLPQEAGRRPRMDGRVDCRWEGGTLWLSGKGWRMAYDGQTGLFRSWTVGEKAILRKPMTFQVWRAPTDNDQYVQAAWRKAGYDRLRPRVYRTALREEDGGCVIESAVSLLSLIHI